MTISTLTALFGNQSWAMHRDHLRTLEARAESLSHLFKAGLSPAETQRAAFNGGSTVTPEIAGDVASFEVFGELCARAPWYAKAYMGITDPYDVADAIDALTADSRVARVEVELDCCGGTVAGAQEIADAVGRLQAAGKTMLVRVVGLMASAAYWAFGSADRIEATATSLIGAIGVARRLTDTSAAQSAMGIQSTVVATAPDKAGIVGNGGKVDARMIAEAQRLTNGEGAVFFAAVSAARGLTGERLAAVITGQLWIAADAARLGLVDAVGSAADAVDVVTSGEPAPAPMAPPLGGDDGGDDAAANSLPRTDQSTTPMPAVLPPRNQSTPPAAAGISQESVMDAKTLAALAALSANHPTHAEALAAEAAKPSATAATLEAFIAPIAAKAKADADAAMITDLKAKLAAAEAQSATATAAKTTAEAALAAVKNHGTPHGDPGMGDETGGSQPKPRSQMNDDERGAFIAKHGQAKYLALPA